MKDPTVEQIFRAALNAVRARHGTVHELASENAFLRFAKACVGKLGHPDFEAEAPKFAELCILDEILLVDAAMKRGKRRRR